MNDDIDALLAVTPHNAPPDFAARMTALARVTPQAQEPPQTFRPWQWVSLGAGASFGALLLSEFVFAAFVAAGAQ